MLTPRSQGSAVKQLQRNINRRFEQFDMLSDISVAVNGIFDGETFLAVKYLQCVAGLSVDGRVSDRTQAFIEQGAAGLSTLSIGSMGTSVLAVQRTLIDANITVLADGLFGQFTELGVRRYQQNLGLVSDGLVRVETWEAVVRSRLKTVPCIALLPNPYDLSK